MDRDPPPLRERLLRLLGIAGSREVGRGGDALPVLPAVRVVRPRPSVLGAGHIRSGARGSVYDSPRVGKDGRRPTHLISALAGPLANGLTLDRYEQAVLDRPASSFGPDAQRVDRSLDSLEPEVRRAYLRLAAGADSAGFRFPVRETRRSDERQKMLFQQGRSRSGDPITWTLTSNHMGGDALDVEGTPAGYRWLDQNARRYGLGRVSGDGPHLEMPGGKLLPPIEAALAASSASGDPFEEYRRKHGGLVRQRRGGGS